jgi:heme/copper-type cytochrome/quinol oxidase subunit 2
MNKSFLKRISFAVILFLLSPVLWAQQTISPTVDETMRSHDKIYVVMAVCIVILVVFFLYLIRIDRKVSKKEKSL